MPQIWIISRPSHQLNSLFWVDIFRIIKPRPCRRFIFLRIYKWPQTEPIFRSLFYFWRYSIRSRPRFFHGLRPFIFIGPVYWPNWVSSNFGCELIIRSMSSRPWNICCYLRVYEFGLWMYVKINKMIVNLKLTSSFFAHTESSCIDVSWCSYLACPQLTHVFFTLNY